MICERPRGLGDSRHSVMHRCGTRPMTRAYATPELCAAAAISARRTAARGARENIIRRRNAQSIIDVRVRASLMSVDGKYSCRVCVMIYNKWTRREFKAVALLKRAEYRMCAHASAVNSLL